jgi:energy-coupling factor transporter ATP-binding protein EcfA2
MHVPTGALYGFIGPDGAGKPTTIRLLLGLTPGQSGSVTMLGRSMPSEYVEVMSRSNQPLADAFRAATDENLDNWVHDWAVRMYGPLPIGPGIGRSSALAAAALFFMAVLVVGAIARTRRVG